MKKNILLLIGIVCILTFATDVKAYSFSGTIGALGKISDAQQFGGIYYKYIRMTVKADSSDAKYTVSYIGTNNSASSFNLVNPINTSGISFTGSSQKIIYILPRVGMGCPSDANYCFGAGTNSNGTTVIQGNECNGSMCQVYGVRVNNKKLSSYNVNVTYDFEN